MMALARLRQHWYARAGVEDIERDTRIGNLLLHEHGSRSGDAKELIFSGEMAEAARAILQHPKMTGRQRAVWRRHCDGATYAQIAADVRCSFREVSRTIDFAQALMLRPNWEDHMRPPPKPKKKPKAAPKEFVDAETTIEMGVKNAHRKIVELFEKPALDSDDIADNERAVHTLLAARRSELEYLKGKLPAYPPAGDDQVREVIDKAKGEAKGGE